MQDENLWDRIQLKHKLVLILIIPFIAIFYYSLSVILVNQSTLVSMEDLKKVSALSGSISDYLHEVQKERGITSGYISSGGRSFSSALLQQRMVTNRKWMKLQNQLQLFPMEDFDHAFNVLLEEALKAWKDVEAIRKQVNDLSITPNHAIEFYTAVNATSIKIIHYIPLISSDSKISMLYLAYYFMQEEKEAAGIERALLNAVFTQDAFTDLQYSNFKDVVNKQKSYKKLYLPLLSEDEMQMYIMDMGGTAPQAAGSMRRVALKLGQRGSFGISPKYWWATQTQKINQMNNAIKYIAERIDSRSRNMERGARNGLKQNIAIVLFAILFAIAICISLMRNIVEREQAEVELQKMASSLEVSVVERTKELRESLSEHQATLHAAPNAIIRINSDGNILSSNSAAVEIFDYSKAELMGLNIAKIIDSKSEDFMTGLYALGLDLWDGDIAVNTTEAKATGKSGSIIPIEYSVSEYFVEQAKNYILIIRDITKRLKSENSLRQLSNAIEQADEMVVITDSKGYIEYVNPAFEESTGYKSTEAIGQNTSVLKSGKHDDKFYADMWRIINSGKLWKGEVVNKKKSGELYNEEMTISPVFDSAGVVINFVAIKRDITNRKKSEEALKVSEREHREIIESTQEGYWLIDDRKKIVSVNNSLCKMLGYTTQEMIGKTPTLFTDEENSAIFEEQISKREEKRERTYEIVMQKKNGVPLPTIISAITQYDEGGVIVGSFAFITDITDIRAKERELQMAKETAEDATLLKDKFISLVSHDLRGPLGTMMGFINLALHDEAEPPNEGAKHILESAVSSGTRMLTLIEDLLNISRFKTGSLVPEPKFIDAYFTVQVVMSNLEYQAENKGIGLVNNITPNSRIYADRSLLVEVLQNLISNAIKFCSEGDVVRVFMPESDTATIAVEDSGKGIAQKDIEKLFSYEEKTSTVGTGGETGTGLGLPLSKDIMDAHGGSLSVTSEQSSGLTTFYAKLPFFKPLIMIVDDDKDARMLHRLHIAKLDVDIVEAENGADALEKINNRLPDLILSDLKMPKMDGLEMLRRIKSDSLLEKIPVIMVTSIDDEHTRTKIIELRGDDYISKPADPNDLIFRIKRFIG